MNLTLYQCEQQLAQALDAALDRETGEIVTSEELDNAVGQFKHKGAHVAAYVLNLDAEDKAMEAHERTIAARRKANKAKRERVKEYLIFNMKNAAISRIDATDGTFSAVLHLDRDESIKIADNAEVDKRYARHIPESWEWDKTTLKNAIKGKLPVPECVSLVKRDRLEIK